MTHAFARHDRPARTDCGAALVIILCFLVLLTGLVVIFFSRVMIEIKASGSNARQIEAGMLARSAVDVVTGNLRQEIVNGSSSTNVGPIASPTTLYFPFSPTNMIPQRSGNPALIGTVDPIPNLIRRSVRSDTLAVPSFASAINSATDASYNGRSVSLARWNSHYLIPRLNAGNTNIDSTPVTNFVAPDWVMVTTSGPKVLATPDQTTIGRYAYAIYDEGGLLDANVAGYPSGLASSMVNQLGGKGALALADLTALSDTNASPLWTVAGTNIDNLVGWRNYATMQPSSGSGSFGNFNFSGDSGSATNYYAYVANTTNGFLIVNPTSYNNQTDQAFTTRQALLKFQRATGFSQDALQYLGTFSRDLEQPTFLPDPNLSNPALAAVATAKRPKNTYLVNTDNSNDSCGTSTSNDKSGANQDKINPSLLTVRDSAGQPVMKRRFPLSRLSLLEQAAGVVRAGGTLSSTQTQQIYQYFGLTWDPANAHWIYNHPDTGTSLAAGSPSTRILTLSEIAALNGTPREPDFFETLKAVINCDSLGKQQGSLDTQKSPHGSQGLPTGYLIDGYIDYQLIQIGANLIDQADADNYPTCIYFGPASSAPAGALAQEFYGVENLPYMAGWEILWYKMKLLAVGTDISNTVGFPPAAGAYETSVMVQPILWNPHANPTTTSMNFRITAGAMATTDTPIAPATFFPLVTLPWSGWTQNPLNGYPATATFGTANGMTKTNGLYLYPDATIDPTVSILTFNTGTGDASFPEPFRLRAPNYPAGSNASAAAGYSAGQITVGADSNLVAADGGSTTAIGFYAGKCWTAPNTASPTYLSKGTLNRDMKFKLQYKNPSGTGPAWLTYDVIDDVYTSAGINSTVANTDTAPNLRAFVTCLRADPRTDRWGLFHMATFPTTSASLVPTGITPSPTTTGLTSNGPYGNGVTTIKAPYIYYLPQGITWKPSATGTYEMQDNNTGGQAAIGWIITTQNSSDLMVNLPKPNSNPNSGTSTTATPGQKLYYLDSDGVSRRASGGYFSGNDGLPLYTGNTNSRPVILNRPLRSVAEMGYAFRGAAWKDIDFCIPESGDAALLDAFCINELQNAPTDVTVAGRLNLNTRQPKVLQALIQGVSKAEGGTITTTEAANAAQALVAWTTADPSLSTNQTSGIFNKGPLRNRSELVGKFVSQVSYSPVLSLSGGQSPTLDGSQSYSGYSSMLTTSVVSPATLAVFSNSSDAAIKRRRESVIRALADSGNTRTWNLLIDVIAQTGRYPASATTAADLSKFIVTGESRYWVHVAIDRYTGNIIAESFEPVSE